MVYKGHRLALISDFKANDENYVSAYIKEKRATHDKTKSTITPVGLLFIRSSRFQVSGSRVGTEHVDRNFEP